jgi:hypothetical protein
MKISKGVIIGAILLIVAFVGFLLLTTVFNPPSVTVLIAAQDIQPGDVLGPDMVQLAEVDLPNVAYYITEPEIPQYAGAVAIERVYQGEFLYKGNFVAAEAGQLPDRLSLVLSDPNLVAFVIPVSPEVAPPGIRPGDRIDLTMGIGSATFLSGQLSLIPTPNPLEPREVYLAGVYQQQPGIFDEEGDEFLGDPSETGALLPTPQITPASSSPEETGATLPITKTIVRGAIVISVIRDTQINPAFTGGEEQDVFAYGDVIALVVVIPSEAQELVSFALDNGTIRVALLSPLAEDDSTQPTMGMSWDDMVAFFLAERQILIETIQPTLVAPGANLIWPLIQPEDTPAPTDSPTATPTVTMTPTPTAE